MMRAMMRSPLARLAVAAIAAGLLLLSAACSQEPDRESLQRFQQAQALFEAAKANPGARPEDFLDVASLYQKTLDGGFVCGAVLYNQGNAFMEAGKRGRAIAAYRRALRYLPRSSYLHANLDYALGASASGPPERSLIDQLLFWKDWVSFPETFQALFGVAGLTLLFALAGLFFERKRVYQRLTRVGLFLGFLLVVSAAYDVYRYQIIEHGVVLSEEVVARKGTSESREPAFTEPLPEGAEFQLRRRRGNWLLIEVKGGLQGWIPDRDAIVY